MVQCQSSGLCRPLPLDRAGILEQAPLASGRRSCRTLGPHYNMAARLDHITVVAPSLEVGAAYVGAALGVVPGPGRTHPGMATHNLLLALGSDVYLEVISADPGAVP